MFIYSWKPDGLVFFCSFWQMNRSKSSNSGKTSAEKINKVGELFPSSSLNDYAKSRGTGGDSRDDHEVNKEEEDEAPEEDGDEQEGDDEVEGDGSEEDSD